MCQQNHDQAAAAAALRYFLPSNDDLDRLEPSHSMRVVWIRGRQYFLDATIDPITYDVLSYRLRSAPRLRLNIRKSVA